jgi:hypothetical protein
MSAIIINENEVEIDGVRYVAVAARGTASRLCQGCIADRARPNLCKDIPNICNAGLRKDKRHVIWQEKSPDSLATKYANKGIDVW